MNALSNEELITNNTFERLRYRNKYKKIRRAALCAAIGVICCVIFTLVCCSVFFKVAEIDIEGGTIYRDEVLREASGIKADENLLAVDEKLVENNIVMNYPYIKSVKLSRLIPTTVQLTVTEEKPHYYTQVCGEYFVLSDTLRVLQRADGIGVLRADYSLVQLKMPEISYAVVGRPIKF
ncbi:MAG: FtsQ-type POTRA domain-containing protein, partial [Eubacteriales bacterium]